MPVVKHLKDYVDEFDKDVPFRMAFMGSCWAKVMTERPEAVQMNDEEFNYFVTFFLTQLPHDWDGRSFMNVEIIRV